MSSEIYLNLKAHGNHLKSSLHLLSASGVCFPWTYPVRSEDSMNGALVFPVHRETLGWFEDPPPPTNHLPHLLLNLTHGLPALNPTSLLSYWNLSQNSVCTSIRLCNTSKFYSNRLFSLSCSVPHDSSLILPLSLSPKLLIYKLLKTRFLNSSISVKSTNRACPCLRTMNFSEIYALFLINVYSSFMRLKTAEN